ncbi:serine hydrolase [Pseudidiomarina sp. CB1]|uniref:serine hydrolase domain-containing protein n=1 Tax=Pseudidiomarina sp. CB1 TaxID=2972484 RepID=UPI002161B42A|nr:serine hydrolase domain-containing protein [Pseudidiomarina sp. CB1]
MNYFLLLLASLLPNEPTIIDLCSVAPDDNAIEEIMVQHAIPRIDVAVIKDFQLTETGNCLLAPNESKQNLFNVASLAKPVFAVLVLRLVDSGQWQLDQPLDLEVIAPELSKHPWANALTTRSILAHRSGLPNWRSGEHLEFEFKPSTQMSYSGEGFELLQNAIEDKTGEPIQKLAEQLIFAEADLEQIHFELASSQQEQHVVPWYDKAAKAYPMHHHDSASAADNLLASIRDYGKFITFVMTKAHLSDALFDEMLTPQGSVDDAFQMGLGWELISSQQKSLRVVLHSGADKGTNTIALFSMATGEGLVIFTNSDNGKQAYAPLIRHYLSFADVLFNTN